MRTAHVLRAYGTAAALRQLKRGQQYTFHCEADGAPRLAHLHVDDHLLCQTGANSAPGTLTHHGSPLRALGRTRVPLRLAVQSGASAPVAVRLRVTQRPVRGDASPAAASAADLAAQPALPAAEIARRSLQRGLLEGWGLWKATSFLTQVLLPEGATVSVALCAAAASDGKAQCATAATKIDCWPNPTACERAPRRPDPNLRLGPHAVDRSYGRLQLRFQGCAVAVRFGGGRTGALRVVATAAEGAGAACDAHSVVVSGGAAWHRACRAKCVGGGCGGERSGGGGGSTLRFACRGLRTVAVRVASSAPPADGASPARLRLPREIAADPHVVLPLRGGVRVAATTAFERGASAAEVVAATEAALAAAEQRESERAAAHGALAEVHAAVQAAVMWSVVHVPLEYGPLTPVIRGNPWRLNPGAVSDDWEYVTFAWDNILAAYMLSIDANGVLGAHTGGQVETRGGVHSQLQGRHRRERQLAAAARRPRPP